MRILQLNQKQEKKTTREVVKLLKQGGILVCPSDTVYGLICDAQNEEVVKRLFKIKNRRKDKPLGVFVHDIKAVKTLAYINKKQEKFLASYWPGPLTAVLKAKAKLPGITFQKTIGIRVPQDKFLLKLLEKLKRPLAQTSANISGKPATAKIKEVMAQFQIQEARPDFIIDAGNLELSLPSTVVDLTSEKIKVLREGEIKIKET